MSLPRLGEKFKGENWQVNRPLQISMLHISIEVMYKEKTFLVGGWGIVKQRKAREGKV